MRADAMLEAGCLEGHKVWKQILHEFEPPPMDSAIREELEAFVELRKEQGGAPTDF